MVASVEIRSLKGESLARHRPAGKAAEDLAAVLVVMVERDLKSPFDRTDLVGQLSIGADVARMEEAARREAVTLAALMVGQTLLVALLLYLVAERFVSKPIVQMGRKLRTMKPGTSHRLVLPTGHARDEIGLLIRSANELLGCNEFVLRRERRLRAAVQKMEAQYRQIFDSSSAGIFVLDPSGKLINGNPTALKVIGQPFDALQHLRGDEFIRRVFARPQRVQEMVREANQRRETVSTDLELLQPGKATRWVHCLLSVQGRKGQPKLIEGVMYDITDRKHAENIVRHQAEHDGLTGLKNRQGSEEALDRFVADATASRSSVTVLFIDLDGFKQVNDKLGHKAGDQVLLACAQRLNSATRRASDVVGRLGGDEFMIALNNVGSDDALIGLVANNVLRALCTPIPLDGGRAVNVGASIGMACFPRHGTSRKQLLHAADSAMYEVKRTGKNAFAMAIRASTVV
jgi:diguanylate cyclase (GGDEF)-like protein/PAS domain S-box-containing protein